MKFSSIVGNSQRLDGGAMFGNVPKALWARWKKADEFNRIHLGCRGLLVETQNRSILFETGIGSFMEPSMQKRFGIEEPSHILLNSLKRQGFTHEDITDVVISHLHFDHAGGLLREYRKDTPHELLFPNAVFHVGEKAFERASHPHFRDRASFIPELPGLLENSKRLHLVKTGETTLKTEELTVLSMESNGHTPGMLCSDLRWNGGRMVFAADLIPGIPWVHLPVTMGYDRYPELLINEKQELLDAAVQEKIMIFFTHDMDTALSNISFDKEKKKFVPVNIKPDFSRVAF